MRVLKVSVGEMPTAIEIDGSLRDLQAQVGGWIEAIYPFGPDADAAIICNEEGKIVGLERNRYILSYNEELDDYEAVDVICGDFLVVGLGEDDFESLTDEQISKYTELTKGPIKMVF